MISLAQKELDTAVTTMRRTFVALRRERFVGVFGLDVFFSHRKYQSIRCVETVEMGKPTQASSGNFLVEFCGLKRRPDLFLFKVIFFTDSTNGKSPSFTTNLVEICLELFPKLCWPSKSM